MNLILSLSPCAHPHSQNSRTRRCKVQDIERFSKTYVMVYNILGRLRFHYDNDNEYENDNEIALSFSLRFCKQRDERLVASISLSTTTITNMNPIRTQEMMM